MSCTTKCYQRVLLPAKLHKNRDTNNPTHKDKDISFFKCEFKALNSQSLMVRSSKTDDKNTTEASYRVSYKLPIALAGKAHTVAETIIKPCVVEMAN